VKHQGKRSGIEQRAQMQQRRKQQKDGDKVVMVAVAVLKVNLPSNLSILRLRSNIFNNNLMMVPLVYVLQ
jgi:hypothetical protein